MLASKIRAVAPLVLARCIAVTILCAATPVRADVPDARAAISDGDCRRAGDAINRGMEQGDAEAFFLAGYLLDSTGCLADDPARAARYYRRAAELGSDDAAKSLGLLYGLGRGVPRDYVEAYDWFAKGGKSTPVVGEADKRAAGYAMTVAYLAMSKVRYPLEMEQASVESSFDVVFVPATGATTFRRIRMDHELGSNVRRSHLFTRVVEDAYTDAAGDLPRPEGIARDEAFVTPWRFTMRRGRLDQKLSTQGGVTLGDTTVAH